MSFSDTLKTWHDDNPNAAAPATHTIEFKPTAHAEPAAEMDAAGRERQHMKDWVRKEIALAISGKSEAERIAANP